MSPLNGCVCHVCGCFHCSVEVGGAVNVIHQKGYIESNSMGVGRVLLIDKEG